MVRHVIGVVQQVIARPSLTHSLTLTHLPTHTHTLQPASLRHLHLCVHSLMQPLTLALTHILAHTLNHMCVHLPHPPLDNGIHRVCQCLLLTRLACALNLGILPIHSFCPQPSFGIPTHVWYARGGDFSVKVLWRNCCNPVPNTRMPTYSLFAPRTI
jgi:hypothetical protein